MRACSIAVGTADEMRCCDKGRRLDECPVVCTYRVVVPVSVIGDVAVEKSTSGKSSGTS